MSRSTRSLPPREPWHLQGLVGLLLLASFSVTALAEDDVGAPPLPPAVSRLSPDLQVRGGGELKFFGLSIYNGYYYCADKVPGTWSHEAPFALQLVYHRHLRGAKIAERSGEEIARLGYGSPTQRARWEAQMKEIFVDVAPGDRMTGVNVPDWGVRYFHNGALVGEIDDPAFAQAFFSIWLDPRTSEPALRKQLLAAP